jgi:hypothetical protein
VKKYSISILLYFSAVLLNSFSILAQSKLLPYWKNIAAFEKPQASLVNYSWWSKGV